MQTSVETPPERDKPKKLLDRMRDVMRLKHYSFRTEQTYCDWVERFIRFHGLRHKSMSRFISFAFEAPETQLATHQN